MGAALWLMRLSEGRVRADSPDFSALYKSLRSLDSLAMRRGLTPLGVFVDHTEAAAAFSGRDGFSDGYARLAARASWFDSDEGLFAAWALYDSLRKAPVRLGFFRDWTALVLEELDLLQTGLREAVRGGERFHLGVVM